ncbi:MAG: hypothetical protein JRI72_06700 [Deltaproteobacteria bacterium]|nr:hypothetical protein [Deltaproteobacteria bacterium]
MIKIAIKEAIQLVNFQFKTDKLIQIDKTEQNGQKTETQGAVRSFSIDFNVKKAFALLGIYVCIINANAPSDVLTIIRLFLGG